MWNYDLVIPEFIIIITFLIFYLSQPDLPLKINKAFFRILIVDVLTTVIDVAASSCLDFFTNLPVWFHYLINTIYFLLFLQRIMCFLMFTIIILKKDLRKTRYLRIIALIPFFALSAIVATNFLTDIIFSISNDGLYNRSHLYNLIYLCAFYYIFLAVSHLLIFRKNLVLRDFIAAMAYNLILFVGYIIRILYPNFIIMNFFSLIAIIIIYLAFQNPSSFHDEKSGVFNKKAFLYMLDEVNKDRYPLILGFTIHNYNDLREIYSYTQTDKGLTLIGIYLKQTFPDILPFYLHDGHFVLIGRKTIQADIVRTYIEQRFYSSWNTKDLDMLLDISFVQVKPEIISCNKSILYKALSNSFIDIENRSTPFYLLDDKDIQKIQEKTKIKRAVEIAVDHNSVELFLQPVFDPKTHELKGAESLARIKDENGNYIPPSLFIPIAEKNGRINQLGEQMFEKTCQFIKDNDIDAIGISWINVNLSPIQLLRRDLNKRFTDIMRKYNIPAEKIHLEITEESMIDFELLQYQMKTMKESGFCFVLDDYGRGYSNVARMKKCPFINIKLDMEFVWDYFKEKDKILPTLVQTIKQMGFTVTAEGIENLELADAMRDIGCDFLQGFYFSKPLSIEEFKQKYQLS